MIVDKNVLDELSRSASESPRFRMNRDMRTTSSDNSQRMLNALEPGTVLPIHRHRGTSESCFIVRGKAEQLFYDDDGEITECVILEPGSDVVGVNIEVGRWHRIVSLQPGTVIFEAKDGLYEPLSEEDIL